MLVWVSGKRPLSGIGGPVVTLYLIAAVRQYYIGRDLLSAICTMGTVLYRHDLCEVFEVGPNMRQLCSLDRSLFWQEI